MRAGRLTTLFPTMTSSPSFSSASPIGVTSTKPSADRPASTGTGTIVPSSPSTSTRASPSAPDDSAASGTTITGPGVAAAVNVTLTFDPVHALGIGSIASMIAGNPRPLPSGDCTT